jgi:hypothetical protein
MDYKDTVRKILNKYSLTWNCAASFPISTFMYLWAIYIFPYHKYKEWLERGRVVSFLGIHKSDLHCNVELNGIQ